jgi:hypothetical protein
MSKFKTSIAVDVAAITARLPADAYVHGVTWDPEAKQVSVVWETDTIKTGFDFPVEYPVEKLSAAAVPVDGTCETAGTDAPQISDSRLEISEPGAPDAWPVCVPTEQEKSPEPKRRRR